MGGGDKIKVVKTVYMVGRDTPEPNARGDCARPACGQRSVNRESPGFIRGECQKPIQLILITW